jgi:DNA-binding NtrC family response regulator
LLVDHFTQCLAPALHICQRPSIRLSETQRELLDNYDWPGNITQLRRLIVCHFLRPQKVTTKGNQTLEPPPAADLSSADQLQDLLQELFPDSHSGLLEQSGQNATNNIHVPDAKTSNAEQATGEPTLMANDQVDDQLNDPLNGATPRIWSLLIDQMVSDSSTNLYARAIEQFERGLFTEILNRTGGNVSEAARLLGITRVSLRKKLQHFSIELPY